MVYKEMMVYLVREVCLDRTAKMVSLEHQDNQVLLDEMEILEEPGNEVKMEFQDYLVETDKTENQAYLVEMVFPVLQVLMAEMVQRETEENLGNLV